MGSPKKGTADTARPQAPNPSGKRRGRPPTPREPSRHARPEHAAFAARLGQVRRSFGQSQTAFAKRCHVTPTNIGKYLRAELQPGFDVLLRIGAHTGVSLEWLLLGEGGEEPVMRGQWRTEAGLEADVAARVARDAAQQLAPEYSEVTMDLDGARLLAAAAQQVAMNYRAWSARVAALPRALMPVLEMGAEFVAFADQLANDLPPASAAYFRRHARRRVARASRAVFHLSDRPASELNFGAQPDPGAYFPGSVERLAHEYKRIIDRATQVAARPFVPPPESGSERQPAGRRTK